jgi:hypothetical protein
VTLGGAPFPYLELSLGKSAEWFSESGKTIPPILAEDIARERRSQAAASVGPVDAAASPPDPFKDAPRVIMALPSPLLADPDWVVGFRWMTGRLLGTARKLARHGSMASYCHTLIETEWKPTLKGLAAHVMKVAEDLHNGPPMRTWVVHGNITEAYQLAHAMLREISLHDRPEAVAIPITALEGIHKLLADWQAPAGPPAVHPAPPPEGEPAAAGPAGSPRESGQAADADASGSKLDQPLDEPSRDAIAAYRATKILGQKQEHVARELGVNQGTISRWVRQTAEWIKAGNILPDLDAPRPETVTMDPRKLEQGPRLR